MPNRHVVVWITAVAAMWMYIDRVCVSILADPIQTDLGLTDRERARALGAFFFTYALMQIPGGALADRFGPRLVLTLCIAAWSIVTAATGLVWSFAALVVVRLLLGVSEAGAYPAAAGLVKRWARPDERGRFSATVAAGGRLGGAVAPAMTAVLAAALVAVGLVTWGENPSGVHWRGVFVVYGLFGILVAAGFWAFVRDKPPEGIAEEAPKPDPDAEWHALPPAAKPRELSFLGRLGLLARTPNMWLFGIIQFCVNLSWAFLITLMPTFLKDADVDLGVRGWLQSGVLFAGCVGTFLGGYVADGCRRRFGPRWGRSGPMMAMMGTCCVTCAVAAAGPPLWVVVAMLVVMSLCQDVGVPSIWAFAQDVGGRNVGAALGWGNMLGNFGAALSPILLTEVQIAGGWGAAFGVGAVAYAVAVGCGLFLDATKPVEPEARS
ncbi:MAG: MFS transporter [Gemmataceae bacterium]